MAESVENIYSRRADARFAVSEGGVKGGAAGIARMTGAVGAALSRARTEPGDLLMAAVSGGPDSVALLHALLAMRRRFGYRLAVAHLNHGLRGAESDRDEDFVRELCRQTGIESIIERAHTPRPGSPNLEERAREARLQFLEAAADALGARFIVLGHQADDQAETVLMRLMRGSGAAGLAAMNEAGPGRLLRPMLGLERREILAYLGAIGVEYVVDETNASPAMLRNRVRRELMQLIEREYAPGFGRRLRGLATEMRELDDLVAGLARDELKRRLEGNRLNLKAIGAMAPAVRRALVREFIRSVAGNLRRIGRVHIETTTRVCIGANPGACAILPGGWRIRRAYEWVAMEHLDRESPVEFAIELALEGETIVEPAGFAFEARTIALTGKSAVESGWRAAGPMEAFLDVGALGGRIMVRNYRRGDRIQPFGTAGTRKLHDVFIDTKTPRRERARWPVAVAEERTIWVPGLVRAAAAIVTARSEKVLYLRARRLADAGDPSLLVI